MYTRIYIYIYHGYHTEWLHVTNVDSSSHTYEHVMWISEIIEFHNWMSHCTTDHYLSYLWRRVSFRAKERERERERERKKESERERERERERENVCVCVRERDRERERERQRESERERESEWVSERTIERKSTRTCSHHV